VLRILGKEIRKDFRLTRTREKILQALLFIPSFVVAVIYSKTRIN